MIIEDQDWLDVGV